MLKTIRYAFLISLMLFYANFSHASHAAGMDITYQCVGTGGGGSGVEITVTINTDYYGSEISWNITTSSGVVVASGGPYSYGVNTYTITACVPTGSLTFNWYDSYGDGWSWAGVQGNYSVTQGTATLTSGSPSTGSSGSSSFFVSGGTPCTIPASSQYLVTVKFYRDCGGVTAPSSLILNYSSASSGESGSNVLSQVSGGQEITPICPGYSTTCQSASASITGIQEYTYQTTINLPSQRPDWVLSVCLCCRNNAITTINAPGGQELCIEAVINNTAAVGSCNNSPNFSIAPVPFICNSMTYCYNNGATDIDGDSLVYSLATPLSSNSGGTVFYNGGYSVNNPAGGTTMFDPLTGNLCLTTANTLVTVIAIKVSEYRNGVLIGSVIRDIQVNVINCSNNTPVLSGFGGSPTNVNSNPNTATYTFCADGVTPINLTIHGSDPNSTDNLNMTWNQAILGATFNISGNNTNSPIGTFSWTPTAAIASPIPYYFTVSVTDDACPINASYSYSYSITINPNPDAGISNTISVCETDPTFNMFAQLGGSPTGGGSWFDSYSNLVNNNFNPATDSAGIYTYVLDSIGNCPGDTAYITVNVTPPPNAGINGVITVCTADPPFNMFLQLGGTPLATGSWTDSNGNPVSNLFDPASMSSGTYTYTVLGAGSCLDESSTVTVTVNTSPTATLSVNSPICSGDSVFLNLSLIGQGPFATTISDGINNYNYSITANGVQSNGQSISFTPTTTTTYAITSISDLTGCVNLNPITATSNVAQAPNAGIGGNIAICTNDSIIDLTAYLSAADTGGIWTDPLNNIISNYFDPNSQGGGNFTYTVSASPCPDDNATINVVVNNPPTVIANANPATICVGDQTTLIGSGANTYSWDNGVMDGAAFNPTTTNTYTVTGTDINGCVNTDVITVNVNIIPAASLSGVQDICLGDVATLNFNLIGNPPFTVNFTDSGTTFSSILDGNGNHIAGDPISFNPTINTTYYLTNVTDVNGCQNMASGSKLIIVNPLPTALVSGATTICAGNNTALSFSLSGLAPFSLNYNNGINNFNVVLDSSGNTSNGPLIVSPTSNCIYTLMDVTDNNGCFNTLSDTTMISVIQASSAGNNATTTFCADATAFDMLLQLGGTPANNGVWTDVLGDTVSNIFDPATSSAGTYTYTVSSAPCPSTSVNLIININSNPTITISGTNTICVGEFTDLSFVLSGLPPFNVDYTDGTNNFNVNLNANGNNIFSGLPISHNPLINTNYSVIGIIDANGCSNAGSGMANIIVNQLPNISISGNTGICKGDSADLGFTILNGTAPFNVTLNDGITDSYWLMDNNGTINGLPVRVSPINSTTYSLVEVIDANGCWNTLNGNASITIFELPTALISGSTTICEGENTPIAFTLQNGLPPFNVKYNINGVAATTTFNTSGVNTLMVSPSTTTVYSLLDITDANNCYNTVNDSANIDVNEKVDVIMSGGGDICNDGSQATIDITISDSTSLNVTYTDGFLSTTLSGNGPFEIITNQAGFYMITDVVDIHGCNGTYSGNATITVNPLPLAEFSFYPQPTDLDNPHINFTNASFGHTIAHWDFGDGSTLHDTISRLLHTYQDTGHYKVTLVVDNEFGCTDSITYIIIINPTFIIYIPDAFTPNGDGINDVFGPSVYGVSELEIKIYNRWGQIIYYTKDKNKPWDGTVNNNDTQAGIFTYSIVATDLKDKPHKYVGAFTLFR